MYPLGRTTGPSLCLMDTETTFAGSLDTGWEWTLSRSDLSVMRAAHGNGNQS